MSGQPAGGILADGDGEILASVITQLADAEAFLEANPVPVTKFAATTIWKFCTSEAEVDAIAAAIGAEARWNGDRDHYGAERSFGASVSYRALYIVKDGQQDQDAPAGADEASLAGRPVAA